MRFRRFSRFLISLLPALVLALTMAQTRAWAQNPGAIWTTLANGTQVNNNLYDSKDQVYLNGGPQGGGSQGLPDGLYVFQVTDPSGAVLLSTDPITCREVQVTQGVITGSTGPCPHVNGTFNSATGVTPVKLMPFSDSPNNGGEYKVWVVLKSAYDVSGFSGGTVKTDNFKVRCPSPTITCPPDVTVECTAPAPDTSSAKASGGCNPLTVTWVGDSSAGSCPTVITRTYQVTDNVGQTATCSQRITVVDTTPPVLPPLPTGGDLGCNPTRPTCQTGLKAADNCDGSVDVACTPGDVVSVGTCGKSQTFTYSAADACGNRASATVTYTWKEDTTKPVFTGCPQDVTIECAKDIPPAATVTANDDCDGAITPVFNEASSGTDCDKTITRTWTATDACGNVATCSQTIHVKDTTAPALPPIPAGGDLGCNPTTLPTCDNSLKAVDNCAGQVDVVCTPGSVTGSNCSKSQTFTYTATDACGNTATATATYTWKVDTTPPEIVIAPTGGDLGCNPTVPSDDDIKGRVTATDNCGTPTVTVTHTDSGTACAKTRVFTITATDGCGLTATRTVTDTWKEDTTAPVLNGVPAGGDLGCNPATLPSCDAGVTATDNCDGTVAVTCTPGGVTGDDCHKSETFTYSATDACGNPASTTVTYTWKVDTTKPVLTGCPADVTVQCVGDVPAKATVTANDNCDGAITPVFNEASSGTDCDKTITRTWTATDACGNVATCSQTIHVKDTTAPVITGCPSATLNLTPPCGVGSTTIPTTLSATDNCGGAVTFTAKDQGDNDVAFVVNNGVLSFTQQFSCGSVTTITVTATDACGNASKCTFTVSVAACLPCHALDLLKYYDANTNGVFDPLYPGEILLGGFKLAVTWIDPRDGSSHTDVVVTAPGSGTGSISLPEGATYQVCEILPGTGTGCNWVQTEPNATTAGASLVGGQFCYTGTLSADTQVRFGNVCACPAPGGLTLGFWSNKNGQKVLSSFYPGWLNLLNGVDPARGPFLRNAAGSFVTFASYDSFRPWLLGGTATNMAYMLSVQLSATMLNVYTNGPSNKFGGLNGGMRVVLPPSLSGCLGQVVTVQQVIDAAIAALQANGLTLSGSPDRAYQGCLKDILDGLNNNRFPQVSGIDGCPVVYPR